MNKLKKGDIFQVSKGMRVYAEVPQCFVYQNTPFNTKTTNADITVGEVLKIPRPSSTKKLAEEIIRITDKYSDFGGIKFDMSKLQEAICIPSVPKQFDTSVLEGEYIVVGAKYDGGGTGHGPHDTYPDEWKVTARKLKNKKYDEKGLKVSFYQDSCCHTISHGEIEVIRKMTPTFK